VTYPWRIRHKLLLGLGLVVAVMALLMTGTIKGLLAYRAAMRNIDSKLEELEMADKLRAAVTVLAEAPHGVSNFALMNERWLQARQALDHYHEKLTDNISNRRDPNNRFNELEQVQVLTKCFDRLKKALQTAMKPGIIRPDLDDPNKKAVREAIEFLVDAAMGLNNIYYKDLHDRIRSSREDAKTSMYLLIGTAIAGLVLMMGLLRRFYRWFFYPIRDLNQGVERVARGDFEHRIEVHSGDEIEDLAKAFNDMTRRLREMYTDLAQKVNERSRQLVRSERLAGVGFLAAGVAHEINNPLAGIAFCSEALDSRLHDLFQQATAAKISEQDRDIITKYLKMIQDEAFRCKEIIQRLLDFSRGGERKREPADLGDIIQGVLDVVQHLPNSKGKQISYESSDRLVPWVNAQEIKSVVLNIVVNALDSMEEGGNLSITQRLHDGMAELVFRDTGCGMAAEVLENIFEPFFSRSRTGKGTGLGLSISHRIITQHGGEIEAASAGPNHGSVFTVRLPLQPPAEQKESTEVQDPETEFGKLAKRRAA
jgi:two-component system NtrC family sensor kinase